MTNDQLTILVTVVMSMSLLVGIYVNTKTDRKRKLVSNNPILIAIMRMMAAGSKTEKMETDLTGN